MNMTNNSALYLDEGHLWCLTACMHSREMSRTITTLKTRFRTSVKYPMSGKQPENQFECQRTNVKEQIVEPLSESIQIKLEGIYKSGKTHWQFKPFIL